MDNKDIKTDFSIDCVGLACPMPIFKTSNKVKEMQPGQVLEVLSDDDGIVKDMRPDVNSGHQTFHAASFSV